MSVLLQPSLLLCDFAVRLQSLEKGTFNGVFRKDPQETNHRRWDPATLVAGGETENGTLRPIHRCGSSSLRNAQNFNGWTEHLRPTHAGDDLRISFTQTSCFLKLLVQRTNALSCRRRMPGIIDKTHASLSSRIHDYWNGECRIRFVERSESSTRLKEARQMKRTCRQLSEALEFHLLWIRYTVDLLAANIWGVKAYRNRMSLFDIICILILFKFTLGYVKWLRKLYRCGCSSKTVEYINIA